MRREPRRRTNSRHVVTVAVVALVLAGLVIGLGAVRRDTSARAGARAATIRARFPSPRLAGDGHERVLFMGDSLTFGARAQLDETFGGHGVETRYVGYPGTGLLSNDGFWLRLLRDAVSTWHPDIVVIEACCNYANNEPESKTADGRVIAADSEAMYEAWQGQADEAIRIAGSGGAAVRWVITPEPGPKVDPAIQARMVRFGAIYDRLGVGRVDWRDALEPEGTFTRTMDVDGHPVDIRQPDDLHITAAGDALIATRTWRTLSPLLTHTR